jgi:hypothetical protein
VRHPLIRARSHCGHCGNCGSASCSGCGPADGKKKGAVLALSAAALTFVSAAAGTSTEPKQLVTITSKAGGDRFALVWLRPGATITDSGSVDDRILTERDLVRDGQHALVNGVLETYTGKRGTLVLRDRIEWIDAGNGHTIGLSTWRVVRGTGAYKDVTGGGRGASAWLHPPSGPVSYRNDGYLTSK